MPACATLSPEFSGSRWCDHSPDKRHLSSSPSRHQSDSQNAARVMARHSTALRREPQLMLVPMLIFSHSILQTSLTNEILLIIFSPGDIRMHLIIPIEIDKWNCTQMLPPNKGETLITHVVGVLFAVRHSPSHPHLRVLESDRRC